MLRPMTTADLPQVLVWRNLPTVRANMYTTHEIAPAEHQAWWERVSKDPGSRHFVYEDVGEPAGVVNFTQINTASRTATWAFYASDKARRGIGARMEVAALEFAFGEQGLHKLNCEVLSHNQRVIRMHQKFGFLVEGIFRRHYKGEEGYLDVYRLAMFADDWQRNLRRQAHELLKQGRVQGQFLPGERYECTLSISSDAIRAFATLSGDDNPIYLDDEVARAAGFSGRIGHGILVLGELSRILGTVFPGVGTVIARLDSRFLQPVYPDRPLQLVIEVTSVNGNCRTLSAVVRADDVQLLQADIDVVVKTVD